MTEAARAHHLIERAPDGPISCVNGRPRACAVLAPVLDATSLLHQIVMTFYGPRALSLLLTSYCPGEFYDDVFIFYFYYSNGTTGDGLP